MPTVTQFIRQAVAEAPDFFTEKATAIEFLDENSSLDKKKVSALKLLREVAVTSECPDTWKTLVEDRLVAAEQAMRYLLPTHRDHVLHSAHLYLLGLAIYLKMLRCDTVLAAVIADTYYRDVRAFFGSPDTPYSCQLGILNPLESLSDLRQRFPKEYRLSPASVSQLSEGCRTCSPSHAASDACKSFAEKFRREFACCNAGPSIIEAFERLSDAVGMLDRGPPSIESHLPRVLEDIDAVFRRRWGLSAILHDAAYPIELAAKQIDDYVAKTIAPLGCTFSPCPRPFGLNFNRVCDFVAIPLVQNVCSDRFSSLMYGDNSLTLIAANLSHKLHVEYSPQTLAHMMMSWLESSLANGWVDHGVFSALLMLRQVNHELLSRLGEKSRETDLVFDNKTRRVTEHYQASAAEFFYVECVDAAAAVYLHNTKRIVDLFKSRPIDYRTHPFAWLLFLCDQLQEWLRPAGGEYENAEELFKHADSYEIVVDSGPRLFFSFPGDSRNIGKLLQDHLRLFGDDIIRQSIRQESAVE